jgi:hypothetical protein
MIIVEEDTICIVFMFKSAFEEEGEKGPHRVIMALKIITHILRIKRAEHIYRYESSGQKPLSGRIKILIIDRHFHPSFKKYIAFN